jgi:hypothetical protein
MLPFNLSDVAISTILEEFVQCTVTPLDRRTFQALLESKFDLLPKELHRQRIFSVQAGRHLQAVRHVLLPD